MGVLWAAAAAQDLYRPSPAAGVAGAPRAAGTRSRRLFPMALVEQVLQLRPEGTQVVGLVDGAYEVRTCNTRMEEVGRASVCCTGCRLMASWEDETFRLDTVGWCIKLGRLMALKAG